MKFELENRKPARFRYFIWICGNQRKRKLYDIAKERVGKHLDVVNFMKEQMSVLVMQRIIFTKLENLLIRNQRMPYVLQEKNSDLSDKSELD